VDGPFRVADLDQDLAGDLLLVVPVPDRDAEDGQRGNLQDPIHISIPGTSIRPLMRRIIQLDRHDRRKRRIANDEIDVFRFDVIEIRFPPEMALIRRDQIRQPHLGENKLLAHDPPQNIEEPPFRCRKQILPPKERTEGDIHTAASEKQAICLHGRAQLFGDC